MEAGVATVTNNGDSGAAQLPQALADAVDGNTISFTTPGPPPSPETPTTSITLTTGELVVNKNITISGPGADVLTVERDTGASAFRVFHVTSGHTVTIEGLSISNGNVVSGGGIYNDHSALTVRGCTLSGQLQLAANGKSGWWWHLLNNGIGGSAVLTRAQWRADRRTRRRTAGAAASKATLAVAEARRRPWSIAP